jgi:hypothetical protein
MNLFNHNLELYYKDIGESTSVVNQKPILLYEDIPKSDYKFVNGFRCKPGIHIGQRKLFLSELQFLTNLYKQIDTTKTHYIVYAGAAPANHTFYLASFFDCFKFILVDPNKFDMMVYGRSSLKYQNINYEAGYRYLLSKYNTEIETVEKSEWLNIIKNSDLKIFIIEDYFTDELAEMFSVFKPVFISDIRTNQNENIVSDDISDMTPTDLDILWNSAMQLNWCHLIKCSGFMLKFRVPFYERTNISIEDYHKPALEKAKEYGIDFIHDYSQQKFNYLNGSVYIQAFPGAPSSETRLCSFDGNLSIKEYNVEEYENKFFSYNILYRNFIHRINKNADESIGFDHCNDCAIEANIWEDYASNVNKIDIKMCVMSLSNTCHRPLTMSKNGEIFKHGNFFKPNIKYVKDRINYRHVDLKKIDFKEIGDFKQIVQKIKFDFTNDEIIENITAFIPPENKQDYIKELNKMFTKTTLKSNLNDVKNKFPILQITKTFKPVLFTYNRAYLDTLIRFITESDIDLLIIANKKIESVVLNLLIELFNISIIVLGDYKEKIKTIDNKNIYHISKIDFTIPKGFNSGLFYTYQDSVKAEIVLCEYVNMYNMITMMKPNYYLLQFTIFSMNSRYNKIDINKMLCEKEYKNINKKINIVSNEDVTFLKGDLWIIPYGPEKLEICMLYGKGEQLKVQEYNLEVQEYNLKELGQKLMHYQSFDRCFYLHEHKLLGNDTDLCNDCALEEHIYNNYCKKYNKNLNIIYKKIKHALKDNLIDRGHGIMKSEDKNQLSKIFSYELAVLYNIRYFKNLHNE